MRVVGPELRVVANGNDAFAPVGGTLNGIVRSAGVREPVGVLRTLEVRRPHEGRLVLIGGEQIIW